MLRVMGLQKRVGRDRATDLDWTEWRRGYHSPCNAAQLKQKMAMVLMQFFQQGFSLQCMDKYILKLYNVIIMMRHFGVLEL